jgi:hypothetical protein
MMKLTKAKLEKQELTNLINELKSPVSEANRLLKNLDKDKNLTQELGLLISIILKYETYLKEIQTIKKRFPETRGAKRDEEMNDVLMKTLADMWQENGKIFIPRLKNYMAEVDKLTSIQISEEKCKKFLKEIKNSITSKTLENFAIEDFAKDTK